MSLFLLSWKDFGDDKELNGAAKRDPLEALKKWPAMAGLGGFIEFGGKKFSILRTLTRK